MFSEPNIGKFDVRKLSDVKPPSSSKIDKDFPQLQQPSSTKYNEQDYDCKLHPKMTINKYLLTIHFNNNSTSQNVLSATVRSTQSCTKHEQTNVKR